jgi:hypothetical protein
MSCQAARQARKRVVFTVKKCKNKISCGQIKKLSRMMGELFYKEK